MSQPLDEDCARLNARNSLVMIRACFADALASAEGVLSVLDTAHPDDERPRKAIVAANKADQALERYMAGQVSWFEAEERMEDLSQASEKIAMQLMAQARTESVLHAADAVCHAARALCSVGEYDAANAVREAAFAAGNAAVCQRIAEMGKDLGERAARQVMDQGYKAKLGELHQAVNELLASQL